jgi:exodeoxyribonuclease (lambda-induced)
MTRARTVVRPARPAPTPAARGRVESVEFFPEVVQRSEEWDQLRCGLVTASVLGEVIAAGEGHSRTRLLYRLAGELLTKTPAENFQSAAMLRGIEMEDEARQQFAFLHGAELEPMGFVKRTITDPLFGSFSVGLSPDSMWDNRRRTLEIKTMAPALMIELMESGRFPTEFKPQCQGSMWVSDAVFCDLFIFYRGMPSPLYFEIARDATYIAMLAREVEKFEFDLASLVKRIRNRGGR